MATSLNEDSESKIQKANPKFLPSISGIKKQNDDVNATPMFIKRKMQLRIPEEYTGDFTHLTVSKNWLVCLLETPVRTTFLRFFLPRAATPPGEIALEKHLIGYKVKKLFLDPSGHHLLVSLTSTSAGVSPDLLYIYGNGPKVRRIEKIKDHEITAVAFNKYAGTESSTGPILLGTSRGLIFEMELLHNSDKPTYRKQVYDLSKCGEKYVINGLELLHAPKTNKYIVIASVADCLYTFQNALKPEEKSLQAIFTPYTNGTKPHSEAVISDFNYSVLRFFSAPPNEKYPHKWSWLCGAGIRVGDVTVDSTSVAPLFGEEVIDLKFEERKHMSIEERLQYVPKTFVLTEYHALLLYADHVTAICLLSKMVVYEEYFHEQIGKLLNIVRDPFTGAIYVYTNKALFNYKITEEQRNIWKIYLDMKNYDMAERYAIENPTHLDTVLCNKAEAAFENKDYMLAANTYADTSRTFEEVCLKFIELEDKRPIIAYIKKRLHQLDDDAEQIKVLVLWLTDLYLTQINLPGRTETERAQWQRKFDDFMQNERVAKCAREHRTLVQSLIKEHADSFNLSQFAIANEDYEEVIKQQLIAEKYSDALQTLRQQKQTELYYKYCPILMQHLPHETVDALKAQKRKLQIELLVPTLITIDSPKHIEEITKYLEYAIFELHETHKAVHNFLLRLFAEHTPTKVITYLRYEGDDAHYDINYALSVCLQFDVKEACVFLQCLLGMWTDAVDLALTFNMALAKETASMTRGDKETCRKLWLRIAYQDIQGSNDVAKALELLKECDLLRIEDLLPFFADFEKIDDFKAPICEALKEYNDKIQELQHDMDEYTKQAERARNDLQRVRDRCIRIEAHDVCTICETILLVKPFFVFACGHKFHTDCLEKQIIPLLSSEVSRKLTMLKQQLESMLTQSAAMGEHTYKQQQKRAKIKTEIEEILAADCLYCGMMIETIDQPFVDDWDQVNVDWK